MKKSIIRQIIVYMAVLILLLVSVLAAYTFTSYMILRNEVRQGAENFLQVYGGELKNRVTQMDKVMKNLLLQNFTELQLLKSANESKRFYASQDIHNYISDVALSDTSVDCLVVADIQYEICLDAQSTTLTYWDRSALRDYTLEYAHQTGITAQWNFAELNGKTYLYKMYVYNGRAAAAFTSAEHFMATIPKGDYGDQTFVLTDENDSIKEYLGGALSPEDMGQPLEQVETKKAFAVQYTVVEGEIALHSLVSGSSVWNQTRVNMVVVLAVIVSTIFFGILLIRYVRREMIFPLEGMAEGMKRIDEGVYSLRIEGDYGTREFTHLKDSFNKLMDEIVDLKIKTYEKVIELKDAELKSIRLQIRPHFFLNAITTIVSLSSQGKHSQIKSYVDSLSKNIRYMFKTRMHAVPVREEVRHVENYFEMQEIKYANCTFHYVELPQELEEWRIPQMLIQTFIENEFKYAVSMDSVLTILIRISQCLHQGEEMLLIEIEDDGMGYPEDVLEYINGDGRPDSKDGGRVGLWSIKRMMELMYERRGLIAISNTEPQGCLNRIWVPAAPVHESMEDTAGEQI